MIDRSFSKTFNTDVVANKRKKYNSRRKIQTYDPSKVYLFTLLFIGRREVRIRCNTCQTVKYYRKVNNWNKLPYQWWVCRRCSDNQTSNKKGVL